MYTHCFVGCCLATKTFDLEQSEMDVAVGCLVARDDITNKLHSPHRVQRANAAVFWESSYCTSAIEIHDFVALHCTIKHAIFNWSKIDIAELAHCHERLYYLHDQLLRCFIGWFKNHYY